MSALPTLAACALLCVAYKSGVSRGRALERDWTHGLDEASFLPVLIALACVAGVVVVMQAGAR